MLTINFTSPNSVFLIHHEFQESIRCVVGFSIIVIGSLYIIPLMYIYSGLWLSCEYKCYS
jgi:hypothetical protein